MLLYYNTIIQYDCMTNIGAMAKVLTSRQRQNLYKLVVRQIGLSIMRNDFKHGDALLSEPELSLQFNVNRSVLSEALKMLGAKGLIQYHPKIGTRVRPRADWNLLDPDVLTWHCEIEPDRSFLQTNYEIRLMFEPMTARLAAARAIADEIASMRSAASNCRLQLTPSRPTFPQIYNSTQRYAQPLITNFCKRSRLHSIHLCLQAASSRHRSLGLTGRPCPYIGGNYRGYSQPRCPGSRSSYEEVDYPDD
jgi:DNA-binding GntR family transcriptional regulator